jgi:hypothetical protein
MINWRGMRMSHVEGIAGPGVVHVVAKAIRDEAVVGRVVDAAHRQGRSEVVAPAGVVVNHVEDHLDVRGVQFPVPATA